MDAKLLVGLGAIATLLAVVGMIVWQIIRGLRGHEMAAGIYNWPWLRTRDPLLFWPGVLVYLAMAAFLLFAAFHLARAVFLGIPLPAGNPPAR